MSYRVNGHWGVSGAYVFDIAKVHESTVDAAGNDLTGKYLAEVPKHRVSFQLNYTNPRYLNVAIDNQFVGHQFDDDLNTVAIFPGIRRQARSGLAEVQRDEPDAGANRSIATSTCFSVCRTCSERPTT